MVNADCGTCRQADKITSDQRPMLRTRACDNREREAVFVLGSEVMNMLKFNKILVTVMFFVPFPMAIYHQEDGKWVIGAEYARADDDDRDDRDDDDRDDDDRDDEDDRGENVSNDTTNRGNDRSSDWQSPTPENLHLRYSNGWEETIRDGRSVLPDPQGRTVSNRRATFDDLTRMCDSAGLSAWLFPQAFCAISAASTRFRAWSLLRMIVIQCFTVFS